MRWLLVSVSLLAARGAPGEGKEEKGSRLKIHLTETGRSVSLSQYSGLVGGVDYGHTARLPARFPTGRDRHARQQAGWSLIGG